MSWIKDDPRVISEEMLQKAVEDQLPQDEVAALLRRERVPFEQVQFLRLEYNNIVKIFHLWQFTSITKLQLNNNVIEKIEGLENLTNLKFLDLSFNKIKEIEGLNTLVNLQDLVIFENSISVIKNLEAQKDLQLLSLGNNIIPELDVIYLRKFKKLRVLTLCGNPFCEEETYKMFVAAYLPDLIYLDNRRLDALTREAGLAEFQEDLEKIHQLELLEQQKMEAQRLRDEEFQLHKEACVELLNGSQFYKSMFEKDHDASKLALLPGVDWMLETFQSRIQSLSRDLFEAGLAQHARRKAEVESFFAGYRDAAAKKLRLSRDKAAEFEETRRQMVAEIYKITDKAKQQEHINSCLEVVLKFSETIMNLEVQLVRQMQEMINEFERNLSEMVGEFLEFAQGIFSQWRDLENIHHDKQSLIAFEIFEKLVNNDLEDEMPDAMASLFVNRETINNAVYSSHDAHLVAIDNRNDETLKRINTWKNELLKNIREEEFKRNRKSVLEIMNYIEFAQNTVKYPKEKESDF